MVKTADKAAVTATVRVAVSTTTYGMIGVTDRVVSGVASGVDVTIAAAVTDRATTAVAVEAMV
jgi:hypothetical protein